MNRFFLSVLVTSARALLAHALGEALRHILDRVAPSLPPLLCVAAGLVLGVMLIEIVAFVWHRRNRPRHLLSSLLVAVALALLAHGCGEALRLLLGVLVPGIPSLVCIVIGLVLGVILVEIATTLWRRRTRRE